jgi:hypothetical protein
VWVPAAAMAADIRAAFEAKRYKFADTDIEDRCASLASYNDITAEELALEYERMMMTRQVCSESPSSFGAYLSSVLLCVHYILSLLLASEYLMRPY